MTGRNVMWGQFLGSCFDASPSRGMVLVAFGRLLLGSRYHCWSSSQWVFGDFTRITDLSACCSSRCSLLSSCRKAHRELSHDYHWGSLWICLLGNGFDSTTSPESAVASRH